MRDYDPTTGRYLQADPLGLVDGASVYGYARQNPGRYTDPTGEAIPLAAPLIWNGGRAGLAWLIRKYGLKYGRTAAGAAIGGTVLPMDPSDDKPGEREKDEAKEDTGVCEPDDGCDEELEMCKMTRLDDRKGAVWGESRCQQCYRQCKTQGSWPVKITGTQNSCRYWRSPRSKLDSLLP